MTDKSPADPTPPAVESGFPANLESGYRAFLSGRFPAEQRRFRELAEGGQNPKVMLVGCCDSRVSPEVIFDARPGEIFVVRNIAALVPPFVPNDDYHGTSAALEFGIMALRVEHIVVMGHAQCGGIKAYVDNELDPYTRPLSPGDFIGKWVRLIAPAYEAAGAPPAGAEPGQLDGFLEKLGLESIKRSLANLRTFPGVKTLEERGLLHLHGAYFGVMDGRLLAYDEGQDRFVPVAAAEHAAALAEPRF